MLLPKEKANELIAHFQLTILAETGHKLPMFEVKILAIKFALISVDIIIKANPHSNPLNTDFYSTMDWWQEVKQEIEKLHKNEY